MLEMDCQLTIAVLVVIAHESAWHGADLQIHTGTAIYPGSQRPDDPGSLIEFRLQASANYLQRKRRFPRKTQIDYINRF